MKKICSRPGCPILIDRGAYCETHKGRANDGRKQYARHIQATNPALAEAARIRNSFRWRKVRKQFLADHPLCQDPHGEHHRAGVTRTATQVHHIAGLAERPDLAFHRENLMAVCNGCHARIEREVRSTPPDERQTPHKPSSEQWTPFG